jgi:hypothetical protein
MTTKVTKANAVSVAYDSVFMKRLCQCKKTPFNKLFLKANIRNIYGWTFHKINPDKQILVTSCRRLPPFLVTSTLDLEKYPKWRQRILETTNPIIHREPLQ